jgi:bifunctional DNA-binding transcriptional regulator/antitoxin component of YhaV-PrlF toxin-antitoxin module
MSEIQINPGDTLVFVDEGGDKLFISTYKDAVKLLNPMDDEDGEVRTYKLPRWLAEEKGLAHKVRGVVQNETDKAVLLEIDGDECWLPISQIKEV